MNVFVRIVCLILFFLSYKIIKSENKALLVGINEYEKINSASSQSSNLNSADISNQWLNLEGSINDVNAINSILINRLSFEPNSIIKLINSNATRNSIIEELKSQLKILKNEDYFFFYFAGHGSRVRNSLSFDGTGYDQTIVASDGINIRNKELSKIFSQFQEKGIKLILVFDCCHSTGITRGNMFDNLSRTRGIPANEKIDSNDPTVPPILEDRDAVIFSAAQRDQAAKEIYLKDKHLTQGLFTYSFIKGINESTKFESLKSLFSRISAIMISNAGTSQTPSLAASSEKLESSLFGKSNDFKFDGLVLPVSAIIDGTIIFEGGIELGIFPGAILNSLSDTNCVISINESSIGRCSGSTTSKNNILKIADLFTYSNKNIIHNNNFRIWKSTLSQNKIKTDLAKIEELLKKNDIKFASYNTKNNFDNFIIFNNNSWNLIENGNLFELDLKENKSDIFLKKFQGKSIAILLPFPDEENNFLSSQISNSKYSNIFFTDNFKDADYWLVGRFNKTDLEYSISSCKNNLIFSFIPTSSKWYNCSINSKNSLDTLLNFAHKLERANRWLNIIPQRNDLPISLALQNTSNDSILKANNATVTVNDKLSPVILIDIDRIQELSGVKRYTYIFAIDSEANSSLIFPNSNGGNDRALLNYEKIKKNNLNYYIESHKSFNITPPFGIDNYFLLTTELPLPLTIFDSDKVISRGILSEENIGVEEIINLFSLEKNRAYIPSPNKLKWSLQVLQINSTEKK